MVTAPVRRSRSSHCRARSSPSRHPVRMAKRHKVARRSPSAARRKARSSSWRSAFSAPRRGSRGAFSCALRATLRGTSPSSTAWSRACRRVVWTWRTERGPSVPTGGCSAAKRPRRWATVSSCRRTVPRRGTMWRATLRSWLRQLLSRSPSARRPSSQRAKQVASVSRSAARGASWPVRRRLRRSAIQSRAFLRSPKVFERRSPSIITCAR